ncbi:MAG: hypothetical protein FWG34_10830 [Oscillospiraceae bacterium]|nr:hypothetical protein [Oscillospiraceae bacterium]
MLYDKKTPLAVLGLLAAMAFIFFLNCGCAQNDSGAKSNYDDILNEAAYGRAEVAEPITGTISFGQNIEETPKTETPKTAEATTAAAEEKTEKPSETAGPPEEILPAEDAEVLFVVTNSGKKYHLPGCYMVKSIKQYLTKEEAEQSKYEPCKICNPH